MFAVLFEVHPKAEEWDAYLGYAKLLRPELERIAGFVDNIRYRSLTRDGWLLSLSNWRDEKSLVRWRTQAVHHGVQEKGRQQVFRDYHLRVGQVTRDSQLPPGQQLTEQRLDVTETGAGTAVVLLDARRSSAVGAGAEALARSLGLVVGAAEMISWDVFDAVLTPGDALLMISWRDQATAEAFEAVAPLAADVRVRRIRIVRDYGMYDRREAPQYYPDAPDRDPAL
ncbi:MAG TPA: antibiotic biosynthesis monooxygenase [Polyangia bacterium]|nr:antibiotic biosynthesis monooxygenase [Polyangia bacterium]